MAKDANPMIFDISRTFCKDSMVALPPQNKWRVSKEDKAISGMVLTVIKQKGIIFGRASTVKSRSVTVTQQGFMIIYFREDYGYVVNLPDALKVKSSTKKSLQIGVKRTCIEIKMKYGNVTLAVIGGEADEWIRAILRAVCCSAEMKTQTELELASPDQKEKVIGREDTREVTADIENTLAVDKAETNSSCSHSDSMSTSQSDRSSEMTTTTVEPVSVRQGEHSVATLRQLLMAKVANKIHESIKKTTSTQPNVKKTSSLKGDQKANVIKNPVPLAKYKSRSAPAIF